MNTNQTINPVINQQQNQGGNTMNQQQVQAQQVPNYTTVNPQQQFQNPAINQQIQGGNNTMIQQQVPSYVKIGNEIYQVSKVPNQQGAMGAIQNPMPIAAVMPNAKYNNEDNEESFFEEHPIISTALIAGSAYVGYKVVKSLFFDNDDTTAQIQEDNPSLYFDEVDFI